MSTFCTNCGEQVDIAVLQQGKTPFCDTCNLKLGGPILFFPSIIPPTMEVVPKKGINWDDFHTPLSAFNNGIGVWDVSDYRQNKTTIDPFDPLMIRKVFIARHSTDDLNDEHEWLLVIDRIDTVCIVFKAMCSIMDFTCQSGGTLSYADEFGTFWDECLDIDMKKQLSMEAEQSSVQMTLIGHLGWAY